MIRRWWQWDPSDWVIVLLLFITMVFVFYGLLGGWTVR